MSKPIRIKITDTQAIEIGNFKDAKGEEFVGIRKMYRKKTETSSKDWKPARQNVTIPLEYEQAVRKAIKAQASDISNAETWEPTKK